MDENKVFTKGDPDEVVKRLNQVNAITIHCPLDENSMACFWRNVNDRQSDYIRTDEESNKNNLVFDNIPISDVFNSYMNAMRECKMSSVGIDCLYAFWALISSFRGLKYVSLVFEEGQEIIDNFRLMNGNDMEKLAGVMDSIYKVELLEFNLHDMFDQTIIDILNKSFMVNGIIKNSYLEREFMICFSYDDYVAYMDMLINNNFDTFKEMDVNIIEYLTAFPAVISSHKPIIKIITDYPTI